MRILITILISTLALYSCAPKYKSVNQLMDEEVQKTQNDCDKRFRSGEFKTESDKLKNCINPNFLRIAKIYNSPNIDLLEKYLNKNVELNEKIEKGRIKKEVADKQLADFNAKQQKIANARLEKKRIENEKALRKVIEETRLHNKKLKLAQEKYYRDRPEIALQQQMLAQQQAIQAQQAEYARRQAYSQSLQNLGYGLLMMNNQQMQSMQQPTNVTCSQMGMFTNCNAW